MKSPHRPAGVLPRAPAAVFSVAVSMECADLTWQYVTVWGAPPCEQQRLPFKFKICLSCLTHSSLSNLCKLLCWEVECPLIAAVWLMCLYRMPESQCPYKQMGCSLCCRLLRMPQAMSTAALVNKRAGHSLKQRSSSCVRCRPCRVHRPQIANPCTDSAHV